MLNKWILEGRLTAAPELRKTSTGKNVCSFSIACDKSYKSGETEFFDVIAWERTAEFACKHLTKGKHIFLSGRASENKWTDKNGNKRRSVVFVADEIYFGDTKPAGAAEPALVPDESEDGDLPF